IMRLGEASMLAAQLEDALGYAERALALARERGQRGVEASAFLLLGEIASHPDHSGAGAASSHYHHAMALAHELQARPLIAHCHLGLAKLHRGTGEREQAASTSPPQPRCTARWICPSGWSRQRPR